MLIQVNRRGAMRATSSWAVLGLVMACAAGEAAAQTPSPGAAGQAEQAPPITTGSPPAPAEEPTEEVADNEVEAIVVVGSRAAQQSANDRKKNARTPTDSIVADDVGSFPDRNVNEAISRIPGVALSRNDFGEGESVAVRGNGPDLTRVELDGIGVQSTTGLAIGGNPAESSRAADMRELPADLIKSVDVVKGSTADMTEGSLGGSIQIKTRTGLDFRKPYFSMRVGAQMNTIGEKWTPDYNVVASRKFLDGRLGLIASATYNAIQTNGHGAENTTSGNRNYSRIIDFDQSPEKTFQFNPDTVGTDLADIVFANSTETPRTLVTKSASAKTKAECFALFPTLPQTAVAAARGQRISEQQTCLNQWNDYTPSLIRDFMNSQEDKRTSVDIRLDYRLTDDITVYAKYNKSDRITDDQNRSRNLANGGPIRQNPAGSFVDTTAAAPYPRVRSVAPGAGGAGFYVWDPGWVNNVGNFAVLGHVNNVVPGSVTVDKNHNVTKMTLTNNQSNIDQISNIVDNRSSYAQFGADYLGERLQINFMAGMTEASSSRADKRTNRAYTYGDATLSLQPNGLWSFALPAGYDETNIENYIQLTAPPCIGGGTPPTCIGRAAVVATVDTPASPAYTVGQMPLTTPEFSVSYTPRVGESTEKIAKLDLAYDTTDFLPFISRVKTGLQRRQQDISNWGPGGFNVRDAVGTFGTPGYQPPIVVPTNNVRGAFRACEPTPGSSAPGGLSCNFGYVPSTALSAVRSGVQTFTPAELRALFTATIEPSDTKFFGDYPNREGLGDAWSGIDAAKLFSLLEASKFTNFECVKQCKANDGNIYDQPVTTTTETIDNFYFMTDFEQELPWGLEFNGNIGIRGVQTQVEGTGFIQLNVIRVTPTYSPLNPNAPGGTTTTTFRQNATFTAETTDWLPSYNLNLWGFDDKVVLRYYGGKTIARPNISRLLPAGNCTLDERNAPGLDEDDNDVNTCGGRIGNPALSPFTATNQSLNLEWYPNRDTTFSIAYSKLNVTIGNPETVTLERKLFEGSDVVDPISGQPVADLAFNVPTYRNGPGFERTGLEFSAKTAFTFLPSVLRHTGADFNISTLESSGLGQIRDPNSGEAQRSPNESAYFINGSLWYDDGRLNARFSYQKRTEQFTCITPCGNNAGDNNYPGEGYDRILLPYNPGIARFVDESTYMDAKVSYNVRPSLQVYLEGRNINRFGPSTSFGGLAPFEDGTPKLIRQSYGGMRIMAGVVFKIQ